MRITEVFGAAGCRLALGALLAAGANFALPASACAQASPIADEKTAQLLLRLISFDTSNPPGNTRALAEFLQTQFAPLGAKVEIITAPNGAATHFIARLRGDGSKKPVLLAAHADVVPVEPGWTVPPFAGVERDGYILGRGAMDFKGGMAVFARAVMMLAENKVPLSRDVIFLAEADEEQGEYGTKWLAENHWEKIDAEFALNEGGWILENESGVAQQVNITTTDKVSVTFTLTAHGVSTHSSRPLPPEQTAIGRLVAALARLAVHDPDAKLTPQTTEYFNALAKTSTGRLAADLRIFTHTQAPQARNAAAKRIVAESDYPLLLHALMRDTMVITKVNAGIKANVIPGTAEATVNVRMLPGTTVDEIVAEIKRVLGDPGIDIEILSPFPQKQEEARAYYSRRSAALRSSTDTALYRALSEQAKRLWPEAEVVPAVFEAGTDAYAWRERNVPVYGIYPYPLNNETLLRMHGKDERVGVKDLEQGTAWVYNTLVEVAGKQ